MATEAVEYRMKCEKSTLDVKIFMNITHAIFDARNIKIGMIRLDNIFPSLQTWSPFLGITRK